MSIDWHPHQRGIIASGGRDRLVKVWDCYKPSAENPVNNIQTIAQLGQLAWRPGYATHIANVSSLVDCKINVWNVRKPHIPIHSISGHKDIVTGFLWLPGSSEHLMSCSKDGTVQVHAIEDAHHPYEHIPTVGLSWNIDNNLASFDEAINRSYHRKRPSNITLAAKQAVTGGFFGRAQTQQAPSPASVQINKRAADIGRTIDVLTPAKNTNSLEMDEFTLSADSFKYLARNYKLTGTLQEMCSHNAAQARSVQAFQLAKVFGILATMFSDHFTDYTAKSRTNIYAAQKKKERNNSTLSSEDGDDAQDIYRQNSSGFHSENNRKPKIHRKKKSSWLAENDDNFANWREGSSGGADSLVLSLRQTQVLEQESNGENGAPDRVSSTSPRGGSSASPTTQRQEEIMQLALENKKRAEQLAQEKLRKHREKKYATFAPLVIQMLELYADHGDVQTCVAIMMIVWDRIELDERLCTQWVMSYLELLYRLEMWCEANEFVKLCPIKKIHEVNQKSTTYHANCPKCRSSLLDYGWACKKCNAITNTCSLCRTVVRGLYIWCQGCGHGGHLDHMKEWFANETNCPVCNHVCMFTS
eukprot:TRINITY_DN3481_c0_g1_i1.p1 TRINITY_DN3481_c0_g1~~TRINITY_DN3481_c0_g1_i1.p1  ORF type:complete len:586 (-),score=104.47 TRINITY_DN3481_c0_g1_i1:92-1849(-)